MPRGHSIHFLRVWLFLASRGVRLLRGVRANPHGAFLGDVCFDILCQREGQFFRLCLPTTGENVSNTLRARLCFVQTKRALVHRRLALLTFTFVNISPFNPLRGPPTCLGGRGPQTISFMFLCFYPATNLTYLHCRCGRCPLEDTHASFLMQQ